MTTPNPDRWREIEALYEQALGIEPGGRAAFLENHCSGDESLRREVESLLFHGENAGGFLRVPPPLNELQAGQRVAHYEIQAKLGEGAMGVVYRALDSQLRRTVAIKVLPPGYAGEANRRQRLVREARAASALNHPNIVGVHEVGSWSGMDFIAMEFVEGRTLREAIPTGGLPLAEALDYAVQIARGLAKAHESGVIHRDIKPGNIMVTSEGTLKLLDFGLARRTDPVGEHDETLTHEREVLGTPAYMSPEQAEGKPLDARSDIFSMGSVLYEMLTGRRAFRGDSNLSTLAAVQRDDPAPLKSVRAHVPAELDRIVGTCLNKDRDARYPSATELRRDLVACQSHMAARASGWRPKILRAKVLLPAAGLMAVVLAGSAWTGLRLYRQHWVRTVALAEIVHLGDEEKSIAAYRLARKVDEYSAGEPELQRLRRDSWVPFTINSDPPGAEVSIRDYTAKRDDQESLGITPVNLRLPGGNFVVTIRKRGFAEVEGTLDSIVRDFMRTLHSSGTAPPGMVFVPVSTFSVPGAGSVRAGTFWMDKYEVTNRQFKEFVDHGEYLRRDHWKQPFVDKGTTLSWEEAMKRFVDSTGQPGPATWELGSFAEGRGDDPVAGVSWYEAAAYADFAGKQLPTLPHWNAAADFGHYSAILLSSNFSGRSTAPVGSFQGVGRYGTYDMAGNVSEWCWNLSDDRRVVIGGGWSDPDYMYQSPEAASPFSRVPARGFRCAKYSGPVPDSLTSPLNIGQDHEIRAVKPVDDDIFRAYRSIYAYDPTALNARVESADDSAAAWRRERVSFDAAYGQERVVVFLFLPRTAATPYKTVLFFPAGTAQRELTSENLELRRLEFLIRSGHAIVYPVLKGMYERNKAAPPAGPNERRDLRIQQVQDVGRTIDYLQTRSEFDTASLAYYGVSSGASIAPIVLAADPRFLTAVLHGGGINLSKKGSGLRGDTEPINFAPRVRIPILMLNGKDDFFNPVEQGQIPLFRLLGTPEPQKRRVVFESGHSLPLPELIREVLPWLTRYQGPVKPRNP